MGKVAGFFGLFKKKYDEEIIRNQRMDKFLDNAEANQEQMKTMAYEVKQLTKDVKHINEKVDSLQSDVTHINGRLEIIGEGTKMELFDTLYHWKKILVDEHGWASKAEKDEVKHIYHLYHDELGGNG